MESVRPNQRYPRGPQGTHIDNKVKDFCGHLGNLDKCDRHQLAQFMYCIAPNFHGLKFLWICQNQGVNYMVPAGNFGWKLRIAILDASYKYMY